jgi:GntR family transcriptional regulator/MocR family aminotransferase
MLTTLAGVVLDRALNVPLHRQLYDAVRAAVLDRRLVSGTRLPPTRELARELSVSRNTVMLAFEQLIVEGYLVGRVGAGTYVCEELPDATLRPAPSGRRSRTASVRARRRAQRSEAIVRSHVSLARRGPPRPFRIGVPDVQQFPFAEWSRIVGRAWRQPPADLLMYGEPAGYRPLREAIAAYAGAARAVRCEADQVIVVSGSQQALDLATRVLTDPGDVVWIEDPGYMGARASLEAAGACVVPVPVDADGIDVGRGVASAPDARLAYVTPSHQFPLGVTMSLARRLALLEWASTAGAWIIEDDYDSEYRYEGRPLASLQGLDGDDRVIYVGTFSKVMFPALRLGYLIVPPDLVDAFTQARAVTDRGAPSVEQAVVAEFIAEGHLGRHIRRMRSLYASRRAALLDAAKRQLGGIVDMWATHTGMHLAAMLPATVDDAAVSTAALARGIEAPPVSAYRMSPGAGGLLLGFAAYSERDIIRAATELGAVLDAHAGRRAPATAAGRARVYSRSSPDRGVGTRAGAPERRA